MKLGKRTDLKQRLDIDAGDTSQDAALDLLLEAVRDAFERFTDLTFTLGTPTEDYDGGGWDVELRLFPVSAVASVIESGTRAWASTPPLVAGTDYLADLRLGRITRLPEGAAWLPGLQVVRVQYSGGLNDPNLTGAEPQPPMALQQAALTQAAHEFGRRKMPGAGSYSMAGPGGNEALASAVELLPGVRASLDMYRRRI